MRRIEELEQSIDESVEKFRLEINKFKAEIEHIKALAELKESKKEKCVKWKPIDDDKYWIMGDFGEVEWGLWNSDDIDIWRYNHIPLFPTKQECEKYWNFMDTVKEKSYEFNREEWEDVKTFKHFVAYNNTTNEWGVSHDWATRSLGKIYFKTEEDAQYIIDNFKEELLKYWL